MGWDQGLSVYYSWVLLEVALPRITRILRDGLTEMCGRAAQNE